MGKQKTKAIHTMTESTPNATKGYPFTNILFEDSQTTVLIQHREKLVCAPISDADKLHELISLFIGFKSETITKFEETSEDFKADIPKI